jgi:hypothetical protein
VWTISDQELVLIPSGLFSFVERDIGPGRVDLLKLLKAKAERMLHIGQVVRSWKLFLVCMGVKLVLSPKD